MKITKKGSNPEYINDFSITLLDGFYLLEGETPDDAIARAAEAFCFGDYELAQRIYEAAWNGWFMFSSPVLSNAPVGSWKSEPTPADWDANDTLKHFEGDMSRALPISCFSVLSPDTIDGQMDVMKEIAALSVSGGGVGVHNQIRATTKKAPGPIPFEKVLDAEIGYYKQNATRRGALAYYMDVSHPDIIEHIKFRQPTGGDRKRRSDNLTQFHSAVNITDEFVEAVNRDGMFDLRCPHTGDVRETVRAREIWETILETRAQTGEPYIFKTDTANRALPQTQKDLGLRVNGSNLCLSYDTKVLTDKGNLQIGSLKDQEVNVWNGEEWSQVTVRQTGEDKSLLKITVERKVIGPEGDVLEWGFPVLKCTPEHRFYLDGQGDLFTEAQHLSEGDILERWELPAQAEWQNGCKVYTVVSAIEDGGTDDTFCFTEPLRHRGVFNGILTGQCSEITLPTNDERTFVCCLSSLNLLKYDEWADSTIVADLVKYLDNVIQYFIEAHTYGLEKAAYSAGRERALGIGAMGWHHYLQDKGIPFESGGFDSAISHTHKIFNNIKTKAVEASLALGAERGEAPDMIGTGRRNSHLLAIAPNSNSGIMMGVSPSIEPDPGIAYVHKTRAGSHVVKNPQFQKVMDEYNADPEWQEREWRDILAHDGSVQHLDWIDDHTKAVFRTAFELDQHWIIEQADARQQYLCQSQSINLFFPSGASKEYFNSVHLKAIRAEYVKGLYYARMRRGENMSVDRKLETRTLKDWKADESGDECVACQG